MQQQCKQRRGTALSPQLLQQIQERHGAVTCALVVVACEDLEIAQLAATSSNAQALLCTRVVGGAGTCAFQGVPEQRQQAGTGEPRHCHRHAGRSGLDDLGASVGDKV